MGFEANVRLRRECGRRRLERWTVEKGSKRGSEEVSGGADRGSEGSTGSQGGCNGCD